MTPEERAEEEAKNKPKVVTNEAVAA